MSDSVSSADVAAIRRRHQVYQARDARTGAPVQVCAGCGREWPCDVPALLDALAAAEAEHLAAYQRVIRENDDCWRQVKTLMERITALAAIAHDLADQEHGARCEQISALARLGIIVTPAEHVQRADDHTAAQHRRIDTALGEAAPATREE